MHTGASSARRQAGVVASLAVVVHVGARCPAPDETLVAVPVVAAPLLGAICSPVARLAAHEAVTLELARLLLLSFGC